MRPDRHDACIRRFLLACASAVFAMLPATAAQAPRPGATEQAKPASAEAVKAAVADIEKALKGKDAAAKVDSIKKNSVTVDAKVAEAIAKGLREKESEVRLAAIDALRFMPHPEALKALEQWLRTERGVKDDAEVYAAALKGLGQHGSKGSIDLLLEDLWTVPDHAVLQARILSMGRIRDRAAVESLMDLLKSAGPNKVDPYMGEFRLALMALTGVDQGKSRDMWTRWWQDQKDKFVLPKTEPDLPKADSWRWKTYWGEQMGQPRGEKRGERGTDERRLPQGRGESGKGETPKGETGKTGG